MKRSPITQNAPCSGWGNRKSWGWHGIPLGSEVSTMLQTLLSTPSLTLAAPGKMERTGQESALQSLNLSTLWKEESLLLIHSRGHWDPGRFHLYSCSKCSPLFVEFIRISTLKLTPNSEISGLPTPQHCFRWPSLWIFHQTLIGSGHSYHS